MLTRLQLSEISRREGVPLHAIERDYVQHLMLRRLPRRFAFKGGTCLRIAYGSPRYSEDLDFNADNPSSEVGELLRTAAHGLMDFGIRADVTAETPSKGNYLSKLRYEGPLFDGSPRSRGSFRLEVSLRGEEVRTEEKFVSRTPYPDVPQLVLRILTPGHLFAEKTRALIIRRKPRDLFDVHFLLARGIDCSRTLLDKKMELYRKRFSIEALGRAVATSGRTWNRDLEPLLGEVPPFEPLAEEVLSAFHRKVGKVGT